MTSCRSFTSILIALIIGIILVPVVPANFAHASNGSLTVIAMTHNQFVANDLPGMLEAYGDEQGIDINFIITPSISETILRQFALRQPIDVVIVPFDQFLEMRDAGWLQDISNVLPELRPGGLIRTNQPVRWMWGSVDGRTRCGYVPGDDGHPDSIADPSYVCLWRHSPVSELAADLIYYLVEHAPTADNELSTARTFMRKLLVEEDYKSVYDYMLHPDRKARYTQDDFIVHMETMRPCEDGHMADLRLGGWETNINNLIDPDSGTFHFQSTLMNVLVSYTCQMPLGDVFTGSFFIMAPHAEPLPFFYPYERFDDRWGEGLDPNG